MKDAILCYIFKDNQILLQKKIKGKFGGGKWNAPGGKIRILERPERAAIREVREETDLRVRNLQKHGLLRFSDEKGKSFEVHVFSTNDFQGEPVNKGEGELKWFPTKEIPYEDMWEDDKLWLPHLFSGKQFRFEALFTEGFKKMISLNFVSDIEA